MPSTSISPAQVISTQVYFKSKLPTLESVQVYNLLLFQNHDIIIINRKNPDQGSVSQSKNNLNLCFDSKYQFLENNINFLFKEVTDRLLKENESGIPEYKPDQANILAANQNVSICQINFYNFINNQTFSYIA